uniref:Odorant receptor n=1 Tax=Sirex noctilio TaxID=36765 RepID=A0A857N7N2_9HYME|nr:odorant receptor 27 [Sirex noctilio]
MDISKAMELLTLNQRVFAVMGVWPLSIDDRIFTFFAGYMAIHCCLEYAELIQYIDNLEYVVSNLTETWTHTMSLFKLSACRYNVNQLRRMLLDIEKDYMIDKYETPEEWQAFYKYNRIGYKFMKISLPVIIMAAVMYYLKPLTGQLSTSKALAGNSSAYVIPYRTRLFFEITDLRTYVMVYLYQMPVVPIVSLSYSGTDYLLITLLFHVCGQLAVLSQQIKNTMVHSYGYSHKISQIVTKHVRLIRLAKAIDKTYNLLLLQQIFGVTLIICLVGYNVIVNWQSGPLIHLFTYLIYISAMLLVLLSYCFMGDCLMNESTSLCDAFYNCEWYNVPPQHARNLLMCMARAKVPLALTAGKFYILSLQSFTDVTKTSIAILSVLRKFL